MSARNATYALMQLAAGFDFSDDIGSGTRGFDTWKEAERGTRRNAVTKES